MTRYRLFSLSPEVAANTHHGQLGLRHPRTSGQGDEDASTKEDIRVRYTLELDLACNINRSSSELILGDLIVTAPHSPDPSEEEREMSIHPLVLRSILLFLCIYLSFFVVAYISLCRFFS